MENVGLFLVAEVALAISIGCAVATVEVGDDVVTFIGLPGPQVTGTKHQQETYAKQAAITLVRAKGYNV